jgi:hypothetical protein
VSWLRLVDDIMSDLAQAPALADLLERGNLVLKCSNGEVKVRSSAELSIMTWASAAGCRVRKRFACTLRVCSACMLCVPLQASKEHLSMASPFFSELAQSVDSASAPVGLGV